mmetsp:Transcript_21874/g.65527  ORF Transcript_21874/g.65527 Transcript_21874/m.65527 type:complete len:147 (-) Transcript_21874:39-479(-)
MLHIVRWPRSASATSWHRSAPPSCLSSQEELGLNFGSTARNHARRRVDVDSERRSRQRAARVQSTALDKLRVQIVACPAVATDTAAGWRPLREVQTPPGRARSARVASWVRKSRAFERAEDLRAQQVDAPVPIAGLSDAPVPTHCP